jgi:UDP-3-O-acyl N-acetylglucosamine deacetylase
VNRTTLQREVRLTGVGLFTAEPATLTIAPNMGINTTHTGIVFQLGDQLIPATIANLSDIPVHPAFRSIKPRCTSVGNDSASIATIEHLLSALAGLGITDAIIKIRSERPHTEIPILDGSSLDFVNAINAVGVVPLDTDVEPIAIAQPIRIEDGESSITVEPADSPIYSYTLDYTQPDHTSPIASSTVSWAGDRDDYIKRVAPARTFCLENEADAMHRAGLFTHLSPKDLLVIGDAGPIDNTYRLDNECARHKLLDLIGDLSLVGRPLCARVTAIKSGHALAHRAAAAIVEQLN